METEMEKEQDPDESLDTTDKHPSESAPPTPPDGGWGWVIVISSFLCNAVVDGLAYSFGVLLPKWVHVFKESRGKVALVGSLLAGMYMCAGPLVSGLTNKFGCRAVTITGSIFTSLAFLAASFSDSITTLLLTYGFLGGLGFGLIYLPSIVVVGYYFEKKRALATGIALCGSGIGTLLFATANAYMLEAFSWRSLVIIQTGIVLNGSVFGMLMRPLEPTKKHSSIKAEAKKSRKKTSEKRKQNATTDSSRMDADESSELKELNKTGEEDDILEETKLVSPDSQLLNDDINKVENHHCPMSITNNGSIQNIRKFKSSSSNIGEYKSNNIDSPDIPTKACWDKCARLPMSILSNLRDMFDFSLLKDFSFIMITIGNIFVITGYYVPFTYVVDHALQSGISKTDAAFLLSIIGIANTIGRIASGILVDILKFDSLVINNVALVLSTVLLFVEPFCESYGLLVAFSVLYGFSVAAYVSLTPIIICDLLGLRKLTNAFGLLTLARGVAGLYGPPVAGAVYNAMGSYSYSFWFGGLMFALGSACHLVLHLPCIKKKGQEGVSREIVVTVGIGEKETMLNDRQEKV